MKNFENSIVGLDQIPALATGILRFAEGRRVFALEGDMGAGKTTLIKELCRQLGSTDSLSSPSYSIVNEYSSANGTLYHIDLYRLGSVQEALDIGIEDYIDGPHYCFIEWPGLIKALLPPDVVNIQMKADGDVRNVSIFTEDKA